MFKYGELIREMNPPIIKWFAWRDRAINDQYTLKTVRMLVFESMLSAIRYN